MGRCRASSLRVVSREDNVSISRKGERIRCRKKFRPIHLGEILLEEFLKPMSISQYRLAKDTGVSPRRINEIVHGERVIAADTALRLCRHFGTSERFWMNLQSRYYLEVEKDRLERRLMEEVRPIAKAG